MVCSNMVSIYPFISGWRVYRAWKCLCVIPDDMFRRHGQRLALNVVFLSQLVLHGDAALKEYVAVSELLPKSYFIF